MKVVASSKMQSTQVRAKEVSPYFISLHKAFTPIVDRLLANPESKILTIVVSTDKGLCGATNNAMIRMLMKEDLSKNDVIIWGDKGCGGFEISRFNKNVLFSIHPNQKTVLSFIEVSTATDVIASLKFDLLRVVYNKMVTAATSEIENLYVPSLESLVTAASVDDLTAYEIEGTTRNETIASLNEFHIAGALNYAAFNNQLVEMVNRRNAMENATKNANEVFKKLNLKYNRERQAIITTELGEIVSGAAAVDEMVKK